MDGTILVADDDHTIRTVLTQALTRAGCKVHATSSLTTLMRWIAEGMGDVVISDVVMPDGNGLEMLPKIAADRPDLPVIIISAQNSIMTAIRAEKAAAFDYLPKPFDLPDLMKRTARALEQRNPTASAQKAVAEPSDLPLIGRTPAMQAVYRLVARIVNADMPVLIRGESGTGKSLVARVLHDFSDRRGLPYIAVMSDDLADGDAVARCIARARNGTFVIDEPARLDASVQLALARAIDSTPADRPRFLACAADPDGDMAAGRLGHELFFRLSGITLHMPALRDRVEDIAVLANHFLSLEDGSAAAPRVLAEDALRHLSGQQWPGNVRQLENTVRQMALISPTGNLSRADAAQVLGDTQSAVRSQNATEPDHLGSAVGRHLQRYFDLHGAGLPPAGLYARILREVELPLIRIALNATGGNQAKCADLLGINRNTLRKKIADLDIEVTRARKMM